MRNNWSVASAIWTI